jgi:hypothetical protein
MPVVRFPETPTVSTSPAYAANDVVGSVLIFTGLRSGTLQGITITDKNSQNVDYVLTLFESAPTTTFTDNSTFTLDDADLPKIIYETTLSGVADRKAFTNNSFHQLLNLDDPLIATGRAIHGFLHTTGTPTYNSTSDITVILQVDIDYVSAHSKRGTDILTAHSKLAGIGADDHHTQSHSLASHSSEAHSELSAVGVNDHHNESHTVASHSDTTGTGAELNTLTDGSETTLHSHAASGGATVLRKGTAESVTSSVTKQNDNHFTFSIAANETWLVHLMIQISGLDAGGMQYTWSMPSGGTFFTTAFSYDSANSAAGQIMGVQGGASNQILSTGGANIDMLAINMYVFLKNSSTAGTAVFQWAQASSNATALTIEADSWMIRWLA